MKSTTILIGLVCTAFFTNKTFSQEKSSLYTSKFQLKVEAGYNIPLTNMNQGKITDYFTEYSSEKKFIPSISAIWFLRKRFGIEADLKFLYFNDSKNASERFNQFANNEYSENYFVKTNSPISNNFIPVVSFGLVYRLETDHFYFYPKFSIGITSFYSNWAIIDLKEKNSNNEYEIEFSQGKIAKDNFTIIPAVTMGYKLTDRFWIDLNVKGSFFRSNFTYEKTLTNLYTNEVEVEKMPYKINVFETYISVGATYVLSRKDYKK